MEGKEQKYDDFYYVEFVRNPHNLIDFIDKDINYITLDYYDFIFAQKRNDFQSCMNSVSDIHSEAYQSLSLFRKKNENKESDPFEPDKETPFLLICQVTLTPESYSDYDFFELKKIEEDILELESTVNSVKSAYYNKYNKIKLKYKIYKTVNTMDFCIIISTNCMDFSSFLSNNIKKIRTAGQNHFFKYAIFTVTGISLNLDVKQDIRIGNNAILVTRVQLKSQMYSQNLSEFIKLLEEEKKSNVISDTHWLPGRYDLSIRINGEDKIINILPYLINHIKNAFVDDKRMIDNNIFNFNDNVITWIIKNRNDGYMNARIFFDAKECFEDIKDNESGFCVIKREYNKELKKEIDNISHILEEDGGKYKVIFKGYMDKISVIIDIYMSLYSKHEANLSMKMFENYLLNFLRQFKMHVELMKEKIINVNDVAFNLAYGINYFQQYLKVITSLNTSSFESIKYEIDKEEFCLAKFPIAYAEFFKEVFQKYRVERAINWKESEFNHFPKYKPVVIPYMQNAECDFMMTTLFAQNMYSANIPEKNMPNVQNKMRDKWSKFIIKNESLLFIICNNMDKYKDVSLLIKEAFHELGHYCNGMTRKERNEDIIKIFSDEIARNIVEHIVFKSGFSFLISMKLLANSTVIQMLNECIYKCLYEHFMKQLSLYINSHSSLFKEKFNKQLKMLTGLFIDCKNDKIFENTLNNYLLYDYKYIFNFVKEDFEICNYNNIIQNVISQCNKCIKLLLEKNNQMKKNDIIESNNKMLESILKKRIKNNDDEYSDYFNKIYTLLLNYDFKNDLYDEKNQKEIRKLLYHIHDCALFIVRLLDSCESINIWNVNRYKEFQKGLDEFDKKPFKLNHNQIELNDELNELKEIVLTKDRFIKNLSNCFFECVHRNDIQEDIGYLKPSYIKLHLTPQSSKNKFECMINEVLQGLNYSEKKLRIIVGDYEESLADIVMCTNLKLTVQQYLENMEDIYNDINYLRKRLFRLVVVVTYILFQDIINGSGDYFNNIKNNFEDKLVQNINCNGNEQLEVIVHHIKYMHIKVFTTKKFKITLERIKLAVDRFDISDKLDANLLFVRKKDKNNSAEEKRYIQDEEIDFIMKYYYQNRFYYSKHNDIGETSNDKF